MGGVVGDVEALKSRILEQAREQAAKTLDRAQRVSERDLVYAREEAEEIKAKQRANLEPAVQMEKRMAIVAAEMEARRRLLEKKDELVSRIFREAEAHLLELRGSEAYLKIVSKLIEDGVAGINGDAIIGFGKKDEDLFTQEVISLIESQVAESLGKSFQLQFQCLESISAGVIIRSKEGRIVIDNSFSGLVRRLKDDLRGKISEMLLQE